MFRCRLFRSTHPKKLLIVLLAVALCTLFMSWRATNVHSDVASSLKCLGEDGCGRQGKMALLEVATETFEMTEGTPVRLQVSEAAVLLDTSEEKLDDLTSPVRRLPAEMVEPLNDSYRIQEDMIGYLNFELWTGVEGEQVDDLRLDSRFPKQPTRVGNLTEFYSRFGMDVDSYGLRILGYIVPPLTGEYRFAVASDDTSEVWLSTDHQPKNLQKICCVGCRDPNDVIPPRRLPPAPPVSISLSSKDFHVHSRQISKPVMLKKGLPYYVEVYLKEGTEEDYVLVQWQLPDTSEFFDISRECFAMAQSLPGADGDKSINPLPALEGPFPSHKLQRSMAVPYSGDDIVETVVLTKVVPTCDYHPSYAYIHKVKRYTGVYSVVDSFVYPDDHTELKVLRGNKWKAHGNPIIDQSNVTMIINSFTKYLNNSEYGYRFNKFSLRLLELTKNSDNGSRLLLEGDISWNDGQDPTSISQYLYYRPPASLCLVNGFQWERKAHVNLVLTVKNLGQWLRHAVRNLEKIYLATKDEHFTLIVCDFASTDINATQLLLESRLKPHMYKVIQMGEKFMKTLALQAGIDSVKDPNQIVMTMDLHLTLPIGFIQAIRKHTIKGRMAYAPMVLRLRPGYSENNVQGFWEVQGFGLLALCKSDWDAIGGQNVKEFADKWGGEDWETIDRLIAGGYEPFRHRYPGTVHYYHTHKGMWDGHKT